MELIVQLLKVNRMMQYFIPKTKILIDLYGSIDTISKISSLVLKMEIICWNVQEAKKSQLYHEVGFINQTIKPNILILLETMVNCQNANLIIKKCGY